ncbi:MAG: hypothetical protein PHF56_20200 [Desulfuromonadaceae bacterium]|nr:hypothetical protein [Desulfuromonadaceae bacterium]
MRKASLLHIASNTIVAAAFGLLVLLRITAICIVPVDHVPDRLRDIDLEIFKEEPSTLHRFSTLAKEKTFGEYQIRIYQKVDEFGSASNQLQILQHGTIVYSSEDTYRYYFGHVGAKEYDNLIKIGNDVTGNGVPNLVVSSYSGGAHCCVSFEIFELGVEFRKIATLDVTDSYYSHFEKRPGEKGLVFVADDFTFAYWNTGFAQSPAPEVILRYCNGAYRLADDLMRKPAPSDITLLGYAERIKNKPEWKNGEPAPLLWDVMLYLIYNGNAESAWKLFDIAWPKNIFGKAEFLQDFKKQLARSQYWEQVKLLNEGAPVCCEPDGKYRY